MPALKILLSEGSSLSARHTLFALGDRQRYTIDIVDPNPICQSRFSRFCRRWHRCPSYSKTPESYLQFLAQLIRQEQYDVLLPTHEQVFLLSKFRETFGKHVGLALSDFEAMQTLQSKLLFSRLLTELKLPQPKVTFFRTRTELEDAFQGPCYVKLAHGTAGFGVHHVTNQEEVDQLATQLEEQGLLNGRLESLVQQPGQGVQSTVQAVFHNGQLLGLHTFEATDIGVGGMSSGRISAHHPLVQEHVRTIGKHLNWHGALFLDYFYHPEHGPQYIEANPRVGETVNAWLGGLNLCEFLVQVSLGNQPASAATPPPGRRTHSGFMILMTKALHGATRRQLLTEMAQARHKQGIYSNSEDELTRRQDDPPSVIPSRAITLQLLANPRSAEGVVRRTVKNYSLPESAVQEVRRLHQNTAENCFQ